LTTLIPITQKTCTTKPRQQTMLATLRSQAFNDVRLQFYPQPRHARYAKHSQELGHCKVAKMQPLRPDATRLYTPDFQRSLRTARCDSPKKLSLIQVDERKTLKSQMLFSQLLKPPTPRGSTC